MRLDHTNRLNITGCDLTACTKSKIHGMATFTRESANARPQDYCKQDDKIEWTATRSLINYQKLLSLRFQKSNIFTTILLDIPKNLKLFLSRVSKNAAKNQLSFKEIELWQSIPDRIKALSCFLFKKTYKQILLSQYLEEYL